MMEYLHLMLMIALPWTTNAQDALFRGSSNTADWITLPAGYEWEDHQGMDSFPGRITATNGITIDFDLFLMAGEHLKPSQSNTCIWYKEELTPQGHLMRSALVNSNKVVITFPKSFANFWSNISAPEDADRVLNILRTFDPGRYAAHLENKRK